MEQTFSNVNELMGFDFSKLTASKSNYISVLFSDGLPKVKKSQHFNKWRVVERPADASVAKILMEITPRWLTITVYQGKAFKTRQASFDRSKKDPKTIIQEVFEF